MQFDLIESVNYWDKAPKQPGFLRQSYLDLILGFLNTDLIKVLVGQRRNGKSTILKQIIHHLLEKGVPAQNILYLNFELHELQWIQTHPVLIAVLELYFQTKKPVGRVYVFLDEVQEVASWEKVINSFSANERYEIEFLLTGSNANLLSTELSTYLTGRYIEIPVFPFSFQEYCDYYKVPLSRAELIHYIETSGLPELFSLSERQQKISYLSALKDSILINDIIKRFNVKNAKLLALLLDFLIDNAGKLFSIGVIEKKMKAMGIHINAITLSNYVYYLELTFLIRSVRRYDLKGKKILEGERKYYLNDLGFSNYLQNTFDNNVTRRLENFVYLQLLQAGYQVYVGNLYQLEIDFIAEKEKQIIYILHSDEVIAREYGNLEKIQDNWPKWVVSLDEVAFPVKNGIKQVPAWQLPAMLNRKIGSDPYE